VHAVVGRAYCGGYEEPMFLCGGDNDTVEPRQCQQADFSDWNLWLFLKIEYVIAS
jgi:sarcosine oxidase delta subunit